MILWAAMGLYVAVEFGIALSMWLWGRHKDKRLARLLDRLS